MAHVWNVIDGDIYVSKNGDDTTGDGSMASPYASINKANTEGADGDKIVIGTGVWQESRGTSTNSYIFEGDGEIVLDGGGASYFSAAKNDKIINAKLVNYPVNRMMYYTTDSDMVFTLENCYVENLTLQSPWQGIVMLTLKKTVIDKVLSLNDSGSASCAIDAVQSTFVNIDKPAYPSTYRGLRITRILNCIIADSPNFQVSNPTGDQIVEYNCIYNTNIVHYNIYNTVTFYFSITLNPKFNNPQIGDYTLKADSPCVYAGKNNATVGAFGLGYSFDANSSEFTEEGGAVFSQTTAVNDIIRTQQTINGITRFLFQLAAGHASGNVESEWIDLQTIRYLLITRLFANIINNASGVATSRPDNLETAGEKAVYYDFELKYCNEESEKATATFKNVIWNKAVTIDNSDRGNADGAFVASEAKYISARFIKIKLYMTEA